MKRQGWIVLAAFLGGILLANLSGKQLLANDGMMNSYYLKQYACHKIDCDRLFCYVLLERMKAALLIVLLGKAVGGKYLFEIVESILGMILGYFMVAALVNLGIAGLAVLAGGIFPQWLFYQAAFYLYAKCSGDMRMELRYGNRRKRGVILCISMFVAILILFFIGIIAESYLSPHIFEKILKIF